MSLVISVLKSDHFVVPFGSYFFIPSHKFTNILFQASGKWSGKVPHCEAFSTMGVITFTLVVVFVVVVITCMACCCLHGKKIKIALFSKLNLSLGKRLDTHVSLRAHDVFVVYNHGDQDRGFVHDELLPLLGQHGISYITEDCFIPGRDVFTCLEIYLKQSRSALVIVTPDFLRENWNLYHLNQVVCTEIHQTNFKVVFLLRQSLKALGQLPENLNLFLRVNATIKGYKKDWEERLIYELQHKTKKPVTHRLTFGNDSDVTSHTFHFHNSPVESEVSLQLGSTIEIDMNN